MCMHVYTHTNIHGRVCMNVPSLYARHGTSHTPTQRCVYTYTECTYAHTHMYMITYLHAYTRVYECCMHTHMYMNVACIHT